MAIFRHPPPPFVGGHQPLAPANDIAADLASASTPTVIWFLMEDSTMPAIIPVKREMVSY